MLRWYVISTKPKNEDRAASNIALGGFDVLAPKLKVRKYRELRFIPVIEAMFPGYIFAKFDSINDFHLIKYSRGVKTIVHFGDRLVPIQEGFIEFIRSRLVDGIGEIQRKSFRQGERILVTDGPFKGVSGIFERELDGKERVAILLEGISYAAKIEIDRDLLATAE